MGRLIKQINFPEDLRKFRKGDFIVMDFGALYNGYHADMTRTLLVGKPTSKHKEIYDYIIFFLKTIV